MPTVFSQHVSCMMLLCDVSLSETAYSKARQDLSMFVSNKAYVNKFT